MQKWPKYASARLVRVRAWVRVRVRARARVRVRVRVRVRYGRYLYRAISACCSGLVVSRGSFLVRVRVRVRVVPVVVSRVVPAHGAARACESHRPWAA